MTTQSQIPLKWYVPFANGDASRVELPVTTADPTRASQTLGFPPLTMQPPESGGVPPQGEDFNGGMNQVARVAWWVLLGGGWTYDATFATNSNIGGYPNGAKLQSADLKGDWLSIADNNQNNPDTGSGTAWVPGFQYGTTAVTGLTGGTVTLTPAQAAKNGITLAGTLGSALTVIVPTWVKNWTITNNTTGAFVTIVKTAAGSGITIPQNGAPTRVSGDGTNITQVGENIPLATSSTQAARFDQTNGRLINIVSFTTPGTSTYTPTAGTTKVLVRLIGGGGGGGSTAATTAGQTCICGGGGSGTYAEALYPIATIGASQSVVVAAASGAAAAGNPSGFGSLLNCPGGGAGSAIFGTSTNSVIASSGPPGAAATITGSPIYSLQQRGTSGGAGFSISGSLLSGNGAAGLNGQGGIGGSAGGTGAAGISYGAGGSGAANGPSTGIQLGGSGFSGACIVYEYA